MRRVNFLLIFFLIGALSFPSNCFGLMSSTNYTIFADSVDSGGVLSASGTYSLEDTLGESAVGSSTVSAYEIRSGYQAMDFGLLEFSLSTNTIDLGTLDIATVASSSMSAVVTSTAAGGYVFSGGSCGGQNLTAVSDGSITAGNEEFGVAVTGVDAAFADDRMACDFNLAASTTPVANIETGITFKAAISNLTVAGARSIGFIMTVSANF